jgi:5-methylthioadenosine/S-adenosylhomocysteine deaminase
MRQILLPKYLVPVVPRGQVLEKQAVSVVEGKIERIGNRDDVIASFPDAEQVSLANHVLAPGFINMHAHSPMTLLRGFADDLRLDTWLEDHIWPAEHRWADEQFIQDGTELAIAEMIRGGTTCFNENYFYPDQIAKVTGRSGIRACIGIPVIDFKTRWASSLEEYVEKGMDVRDQFAGLDEISFSIAPHSMYSVSDAMFERIAQISSDEDMLVHLHLLEIAWEIENSVSKTGKKPLEWAQQLGLLNNRLIAVHMAHLDDQDINLLRENSVNVVHCPGSNLKLSSGICRVTDLMNAGVNVSVGTDGAASNNNLDLLDEVRIAALLAKGTTGDPTVVNAEAALEMITINAARALGRESELGSIEEGKLADLCALDLDHPRTQPLHNVMSQMIYAASGSQVTDVWVAGRRILKQNTLTTLNETEVLGKAGQWAHRMQADYKIEKVGTV